MKTVTVKIENCYGIGSLNYIFKFEDSKVYSVYAPNGFMKTSLAKTFIDLMNGVESGDQVHKERASIRDIKDQDGIDLLGQSVIVIQPYPWGDWELERYRNVEEVDVAESVIWELLGRPLPHDRNPIEMDLNKAKEVFRTLIYVLRERLVK